MLASPASLLLLDEPTNHLDIRSREVLSAALADYEGTLCVISHDRYFLDGFIDRVWEVNNGFVKEYVGNYSAYENLKIEEFEIELLKPKATGKTPSASPCLQDRDRKRLEAEERNRKHKILKPLKINLKTVEDQLENVLEKKIRTEKTLANQNTYEPESRELLLKTLKQQAQLATKEKTLIKEWEDLLSQIEHYEAENI
jgi:ATP-binding cassette subfamily F protein 3